MAGSRWAIGECSQTTKNETCLDHYQIRGYPTWYRHIDLSMAVAAILTILRRGAQKGDLKLSRPESYLSMKSAQRNCSPLYRSPRSTTIARPG